MMRHKGSLFYLFSQAKEACLQNIQKVLLCFSRSTVINVSGIGRKRWSAVSHLQLER